MAPTMKPDGASPTAKHNVDGTLKVIRECAAEAIRIKGMRKALNDEMADVRLRLRDNGVQTRTFDLVVRLKEMEPEAQGEYMDSLKLSFEALAIGGQGDMFLETVGEEQPAEVAAARVFARAQGEAAAADGAASTDNPYKPTDHLHGGWSVGWMAATRKRAEQMRPANAPAEAPKKKPRGRKAKTGPAAAPGQGLSPEAQAQQDGKAAGQAGQPADDNPHPDDTKLGEYWAAAHNRHFKIARPPRNGATRHTAPTSPEPPDLVA